MCSKVISDSTANLNQVNDLELEKIKKYMFSSPYFLNKYLDLIFRPISENTTDNLYRCAVWLSYMGLSLEDMSSLRVSNVDLYRRVVIFNNRSYTIFDEAFSTIENCVKENSYYYPNNSYYNKNGVWRDRVGDFLLRGKKPFLKSKSIRDTVCTNSRIAYESGVSSKIIRFDDMKLSGQFYILKKDETERGIKPDFRKVAMFQMSKRQRSHGEGSKVYKDCTKRNAERLSNKYQHWCEAGAF